MEIGSVIGNYRILEEVGLGGMGKVYRGIDTMLEREVAIKVLRPELTMHPSLVERFRKEAMVLAKLNHPNIALLYNLLHQGNLFFMVMEFVRGETLESLLRRAGVLPYGQAIRLFAQILDALGYAHQHGVIHRDIKPSNIMILPNNTVKVMDFGIARVLGTERMTREGSFVGTLEYMAPEQIRGHESNEAADIYSLGVLLYEMLSGRLPFTSQNQFDLMRAHIENPPPPIRQVAPQVPEHIEQAILQSLAKNQEDRFRSASEFRVAVLKGVRAPEQGDPTGKTRRETAVYAPPHTLGDPEADTEPMGDAEAAAAEARRQLIDEARKQVREEATRIAEEERRKLIEEARKQAEQEVARFAQKERQRLIEEARKQAEQDAAQLAEQQRQRLMEEARKQAEQEAAERAAAERQRMMDEARKRAEQEAAQRAASERLRLVDLARRQVEQQAAHLAAAERQRLIEEARKRAEQEAARLAAEEEQRLIEDARKQAEQEAARFAAEERKKLIEEALKRAEQQASQRAAAERHRLIEEARRHAEQEAATRAHAERERLMEEARKEAGEEAGRIAAEEEQRLFEQALKQAEVEAVQLAATERTRLLTEARKRAEQEASQRASKERQRLVEAARKQAEEEAAKLSVVERDRLLKQAHKVAEQEAAERAATERQQLIEEAIKRAEQEASHLVATERERLVEEARKEAEQEAAQLAVQMEQRLVEQARKSAEQEISRLAEQERARLLDEARKKAEAEAASKASKERQRLIEEARKKAEREAAPLAEEERGRLVEESMKQAEAEAAQFAEEELQRLLEEARKKAEREAARNADKQRKRLFAEGRKRVKQEAQRQSAEMIAPQDPYATINLSGKISQFEQGGEELSGDNYASEERSRLPIIIGASAALLIALAAIIYYVTSGVQKPPGPTAPGPPKPDMVRVPGGTFRMGRDNGQQPDEDQEWSVVQTPAHDVKVEPFLIDRKEVVNAEYLLFVNNGHQPPSDWGGKTPPKGTEQWPVCNVSLQDAMAFAAWRSKRDGVTYYLPTETEWELAAKGLTQNRYPWGNDWVDNKANLGTNLLKPTGFYPGDVSPYGALDMIGNVSEWTSTRAAIYPGNQQITPQQMQSAYGDCFVVRGGHYLDSPKGKYPISVTARSFFKPADKRSTLGFRLARKAN
ncbi:MAG: SUMF1/EgtB/PvdO family nonheme iron enzyme [Blastocatellales bacterium]